MDELVLNFFALKYSMPKKGFSPNNERTTFLLTFIVKSTEDSLACQA